MIKVAIIDDNKISRLGIRSFLADDEIEIIGEATDGASGIKLAQEMQPDVIILDLYLPDIPGIQVCNLIHKKNPTIQIIFLTVSQHLFTLSRLLRTPARGLLNKNSSFSGVEAVKTVYKGKPYVQPNLGYDLINYMRTNHEGMHRLTEREHQALIMIAQGKTHEKIAEVLSISSKTVSNIKFRGMKKLQVKTLPQLQEVILAPEKNSSNL